MNGMEGEGNQHHVPRDTQAHTHTHTIMQSDPLSQLLAGEILVCG